MSRPYEHRKAQQQRRLIDLGICQACGASENLQGHHIWEYAKGGSSMVECLITLCVDCHQRMIHREPRITIRKTENRITVRAKGAR